MDCINLSQLIAYQNHLLSDEENQQIQQHLFTCNKCNKQADTYQEFNKFLKRTLPLEHSANSSECYDDFELTAFFEGASLVIMKLNNKLLFWRKIF